VIAYGGYDAVHLAAAERVRDRNLVLVAGDSALLDAAASEGMAVAVIG
jgi:predicted nucleic acid-binding protein